VIIRQQVIAGATDKQITDYMVQRYGIFVLLKPPFSGLTALLYAMPVVGLMLGFFAFWLARRGRVEPPAPLSDADRARLKKLLP
jgi:cytochrome c-type biogenesis protein CcmH